MGRLVDKEVALKDLELLMKKWKEYLERYLRDYLDEELREVLRAM